MDKHLAMLRGVALLAVPLARSSPRQARYGSVILGLLAYLVGVMLMLLGTDKAA